MRGLAPIERRLAEAVERLRRKNVVERLWAKDHTLWGEHPEGIADRLGWLDLPSPQDRADAERFADEVRADGIRHAVLLGMGGSSLGAEALREILKPSAGDLALHVLDSVHPAWIRRFEATIDLPRTLFLAASKSGTTTEARALLDHFWQQASARLTEPGRHFAAMSDPGTPLTSLAGERGFRRSIATPPEVGGRFSVLSPFGLVPAALAGIDTERLRQSARAMAERCRHTDANPGAYLGAVLGAAADLGRRHLTLLLPEALRALGLWIEQLVAESTGKAGRGIVPVTGEPPAPADIYGDRRLFVHLDLSGSTSPERREARRLVEAGQPVVELELASLDDLGGELFRWELAIAVAGHLLGIQPFDQPDVDSTKRETRRLLARFEVEGSLPRLDPGRPLAEELRSEPDYVALLAYADASPPFEDAVDQLRAAILRRHGSTTTFAYGPRYLHSTGQLHKGGPSGGLHVILLDRLADDPAIPDRPYGFGTLLRAQAAADAAALRAAGRRCIAIELGSDAAADLRRLASRT